MTSRGDPVMGWNISFDPGWGRIAQYRGDAKAARRVAVLTEVYGPRDADRNLAAILDRYLADDIPLVCWENFEGPVELTPATAATEVARTLAGYVTRSGRFALARGENKSLWRAWRASQKTVTVAGVDDLQHRQVMVDVQQFAVRSWPRFQPQFERLEETLLATAGRVVSAEAAQLLQLQTAWRQSRVGLAAMSKALLQLADRHQVALAREARRTLLAHARSERTNLAAAQKERDELIERIAGIAAEGFIHPAAARRLAREDGPGDDEQMIEHARERVAEFANYLRGNTVEVPRKFHLRSDDREASGGFADFAIGLHTAEMAIEQLASFAVALNVDLAPYPSLQAFVEQVRLLVPIADTSMLNTTIAHVQSAFKSVGAALFRRDVALLDRARHLDLLARLGKLELDNAGHDQLLAELDHCSLQQVVEMLRGHGARIDAATVTAAREFDQSRRELLRFYESARVRATAMATGTLECMQSLSTDRAVLLCLGFHVDTICSVFRGNGVSYTVINPKFDVR